MEPYKKKYDEFIKDIGSREIEGCEAAKLVLELSQSYAEYNMRMIACRNALAITARDIETREDENTGKTISSAKAQVLTSATEESRYYEEMRGHVLNHEQFIASLKTYIKSLGNEYSLQNNT